MAKISTLFLFLFFSIGFGQSYHFDFLAKYKAKNSKNKFSTSHVTYTNTNDFSYCLYLHKSTEDFTADLFDYGRNEIHHFSVEETKENDEIQFTFSYLKSTKIRFTKHFKNYRCEFSKVSEDSPLKISLNVYQSKKAKNPILEQDITLINSDKNLFPVFNLM